MSETPVTLDFVALISLMSARTVERLIDAKKLPKPPSKYRREWIGPTALTALADALAKLPEPSARHASAIIEKIRGQIEEKAERSRGCQVLLRAANL
jgi:hypothetical protein